METNEEVKLDTALDETFIITEIAGTEKVPAIQDVANSEEHNDILDLLLSEIGPENFRVVLNMQPDENLSQKDIIVGVIKSLLTTAKQNSWSLCQSNGYLYVYNGAFWKQCSEDSLKKFLSNAAERMGIPYKEAQHNEFASKLLKQFLFAGHLPSPEPDEERVLINLQNGTFEFAPGIELLRDFDQSDFLTYQLPFAYDPEAKCPLFEKYLLRVLPDTNSRDIIQEFAGFIFTKMNLEKCLVLYGSGGNGKSVFFNIIHALLGHENFLTYPIGLFGHEYNRAKLSDKLVNYSSEKGFDLHPDTFKALVSGEPLQAREPYGKSYTIYNSVKFIVNCNELPSETEQTEAYFRRFLIVPFSQTIPEAERDITLAERIILNELPGVFNWLLCGLERLVKQQKFSPSTESDRVLAEFRTQSDSVQLFLDEYRYIKPDSDADPYFLADLYHRYKEFCKDNNYRALGKNKFSERLEKKGFEKHRHKSGYLFRMAVKLD